MTGKSNPPNRPGKPRERFAEGAQLNLGYTAGHPPGFGKRRVNHHSQRLGATFRVFTLGVCQLAMPLFFIAFNSSETDYWLLAFCRVMSTASRGQRDQG